MKSEILQDCMRQLLNDDSLFIVTLDTKGRVTYANSRVEQVFKSGSAETLIGRSWLELTVPQEQLPLMTTQFQLITSGKTELLNQAFDSDVLTPSGLRLRILWSNHLLRNDQGQVTGTLSFGQDVTKQKMTQFRLDLHQDVARLISDSSSFYDAGQKLLQLVCERFDWDYGEIWLVDNVKQVMGWHSCWHRDKELFLQFVETSQKLTFTKGEGMPGLIWQCSQSTWIDDIAERPRFVRRYAAQAIGMHASFGFPIFAGAEVVGAIDFLSRQIQALDSGLISLFDSVGQQMGNYYQREKVERQLKIWDELFRNSGEAMFVTDATPVILAINEAFTRLTGYLPEEIAGKSPDILQSNRNGPTFYETLWSDLNNTGSWQGEIWDRRKDGGEYLTGLTITRIKNEQGETTHYIATYADVSERKVAEERIRHLEFYDLLTGLPNRSLLMEQVGKALAHGHRYNRHVATFSIDIDRFKVVNDSLGHDLGDQILQRLAQRLQENLREGDILSRPGGDEFIIALPNIEELNTVVMLAERIIKVVRLPMKIGEMEFNLTASIGISVYPGDGADQETLLKNADAAMHFAKETGSNKYIFFTSDMNETVSERLRLETLLHKALARKELLLHYQPQIDLRMNRVVGLEALVRWNQPEEGLIPPGKFIPLAEENGLIVPIGDWILAEACREWRLLAKSGLPAVTLAVNISSVQFYEATFLEKISRQVKKCGLESYLEIEVTEGVMMRNVPATTDIMHKLKAIGCKLSIDDFGTGYSSLGYLSRFPLDKLKIDQSFVRAMLASQTNMAIVDTIIKLANNLNLRVIAEGVETGAELNALRVRNCDEVQGYLFARPMPMEELIPWWVQWNKLR